MREYVQRVDDTGNPSQASQQDVDQKIRTATALEEDADWWQQDCEDHLADVSVSGISILCRCDEVSRPVATTHDPVKGMLAVVLGGS